MDNEKLEKVLVVGGGGRVGYPFAQYCSYRGFDVKAYDRDPTSWIRAQNYVEADVPTCNRSVVASSDRNTYLDWIVSCEYMVIMIGTPIDAEGNPRIDGLYSIIDDIVEALYRLKNSDGLQKIMLKSIILRSTVSPGTTNQFDYLLNKKIDLQFRSRFEVTFCPERISQGNTFKEMPILPQLVGCLNDRAAAIGFFKKLTKEVIPLPIVSAELGKLMTNMYRYVNFALANEFVQIAYHHNVDFEQLRNAINKDYSRMDLPAAGPAAGPCLFKDGQFLVSHIPYTDLIRTSFTINARPYAASRHQE